VHFAVEVAGGLGPAGTDEQGIRCPPLANVNKLWPQGGHLKLYMATTYDTIVLHSEQACSGLRMSQWVPGPTSPGTAQLRYIKRSDEMIHSWQSFRVGGHEGTPEVGAPRAPEESASSPAAEAASVLTKAMLMLLILHTSDCSLVSGQQCSSVYSKLRHWKCQRSTRFSE
jgi:hypothetical protein